MQSMLFEKWMKAGQVSIPILLLSHYQQMGITDEECMLLIHLHAFIESGNHFPTPKQLASRMSMTETHTISLLRTFIQKGVVHIETEKDSENGMMSEAYSLYPLWERILQQLGKEDFKRKKEAKAENEMNMYTMFEQEFGRPLSPMEIETLTIWLDDDKYSPELIAASLKESVLSGKLNFRYMDRILFEWKKNGVQTVEGARTYGEKFRNKQKNASSARRPESRQENLVLPTYNWLDS